MSDPWAALEVDARSNTDSSEGSDESDLTSLDEWDFPDEDGEEEVSPRTPSSSLPNWDQLRNHIDHRATGMPSALLADGTSSDDQAGLIQQLQRELDAEKRKVDDYRSRLAQQDSPAMQSQMEYLREQLAAERRQREGHMARANGMRDSLDKAQKEAKAYMKRFAKEQALASERADELAKAGEVAQQERSQRDALEGEMQTLKEQLSECQAKLASSEAECKRLTQSKSLVRQSPRSRSGSSPISPCLNDPNWAGWSAASPRSRSQSTEPVSSATLQQQFTELTEAIMRIPVRQSRAVK